MTNCRTNNTPNLPLYAECDGSPTSAKQRSHHTDRSVPGALMDPVLQVTETIITTTTFYSPRDKPARAVSGDSSKASGLVNKLGQERGALGVPSSTVQVPTIQSAPTPQLDKELPRIPSGAAEDVSLRTTSASPTISVIFPSSSDHGDTTSAAFLAHAALRLSSPALGFALERPFRQSFSQRGLKAGGSPTFAANSPEPRSPPRYSMPAEDRPGMTRSSVDALESSSHSVGLDGRPAQVAPHGSTSLPVWPQTGAGVLFRSRSMYGRVLAEPKGSASDTEFGITPRSSTIGYGYLPINSIAGDTEGNAAVKRFWKLPFRGGTIKSSSHRPQTSDGTPVPTRREQLYTVPPPLEYSAQLAGRNVEHAVTPTPTSTRRVLSRAVEMDVTPLPQKYIRRAASVPKLALGKDIPATRQRSMSLFQRSRLTGPPAGPYPSQSHPMFSFQAPRTIPLHDQSPLLRKLSRPFLNSKSRSGSDVRQSFLQLGILRQPEPPRASPAAKAGDESPEAYVLRMSHSVNHIEIAGILAASKDMFFSYALGAYMRRFNFRNQPLDIALRLLLLEAKLPQETQQIDRILGAFAKQYEECNSQLYSAPDTAYVLAYSLVLLHSDAFNKANKIKMQKDAYVRNTRLPGIQSIVLEYFYDNITAQPFRRASEHPDDIGQSVGIEGHPVHLNGRATSSSSSAGLRKSDVYNLIEEELLHALRVDVRDFVPSESPFRVIFSKSFPEILEIFEGRIQVRQKAPSKRKDIPPIGLGPTGDTPTPHCDSFRIIKAGVLRRRDEMLLGNQKNRNRKWKSWTTILTTSQLLFFRGVSVMTHIDTLVASGDLGAGIDLMVEPEDVVSLQDAFSVKEEGLNPDMFRFVSPSRHQYILQADVPEDADLWMTLINYASVFRTSGLHIRTKRAKNGTSLVPLNSYASSSFASCTDSDVLSCDVHEQRMSYSDIPQPLFLYKHPRSVVTRARLRDVQVQTERSRVALASEIRQVRNLAILTPLHKSTRNRIVAELQPLARRVKQLRLQIKKLECERDVLASDLILFEAEIPGAMLQPERSLSRVAREQCAALPGSCKHAAGCSTETLSYGVDDNL